MRVQRRSTSDMYTPQSTCLALFIMLSSIHYIQLQTVFQEIFQLQAVGSLENTKGKISYMPTLFLLFLAEHNPGQNEETGEWAK